MSERDGSRPSARPRRPPSRRSTPLAPGDDTEGVVVDRDATRVFNGVNVWCVPDRLPGLWEPCSDGTFGVRSPTSRTQLTRHASTRSWSTRRSPARRSVWAGMLLDEFAEMGERVLGRHALGGVETGAGGRDRQSSNPFFGDANVTS